MLRREHLIRAPIEDYPPVEHDDNPFKGFGGEVEVMRDRDDRPAGGYPITDDLLDERLPSGVLARGRLIEGEHRGVHRQNARDRDELPLGHAQVVRVRIQVSDESGVRRRGLYEHVDSGLVQAQV
ncbi:MAG TPA: hypothetical protein VGP30_03600, partial [Candidatus Limnocylindrales bacterium]|nr:hypothetical protein [Candidatus Limnocylindrales bacterium]